MRLELMFCSDLRRIICQAYTFILVSWCSISIRQIHSIPFIGLQLATHRKPKNKKHMSFIYIKAKEIYFVSASIHSLKQNIELQTDKRRVNNIFSSSYKE
jgi:hypothetical protein